MTEFELRKLYVTLAARYLGCKTGDSKHKLLVDTYNTCQPLPRNIKMTYSWGWCVCFTAAIAMMCQYNEIFPLEIGPWEQVQLAKQLGIYHKPPYTPQIGDLVFYDWNSKKDAVPDHVGIVEKVENGQLTTIEGNVGGGNCARRTRSLSDSQILGFAAIDYKKLASNTLVRPDGADGFDENLIGTYVVTTGLYMRTAPGILNKSILVMPKGAKVECTGYYGTVLGGRKWYYIKYNGTYGFSSSAYLLKQ